MRNIKLLLEYDGTDFVGWQSQTNGRSVQDQITSVLRGVLQEHVVLNGAGRTDSGVHARGQVANFLTSSSLPVGSIDNALNGTLPRDVRVLSVQEAPETFHARFDARARRYKYSISTRPMAINRQYHWYVKYDLDFNVLQRIAERVIGEHDFSSFCKHAGEVDDHRCIVTSSAWSALQYGYIYEVASNRFLHGMVRTLVGTMVDIGRGHIPENAFVRILAAKDRRQASMAAPPHGLCLEEITY
jgi:tRNA pseudouridine38-40 synthase